VTVDYILAEVLQREGWPSYTVHPNDRGGPTKGGITLRTLESWRGRRCTRQELQRLGEDEALQILRRRYVDTNGIHLVEPVELLAQMVDDAVLSGPVLAVKDLQRAVGVGDDGIIGPVTMGKVASLGASTVGIELMRSRTLRLCRHVVKNPDQGVFLVGWVSRCLQFASPI
jgi:lysozyme family protein